MKYRILLAAAMFVAGAACAQFNFGLRGGINANRFITSESMYKSEDTRLGPVGGIFFLFQKNFISIQPEFIYSGKNGTYTYRNVQTSIDTIFKYNIDFLDVPLIAGLHLGRVIKIDIGPVFSFPLAENISYQTNGKKVRIDEKVFKDMSAGYQVGICLAFDAISVEVRYEQSLASVDNKFVLPNSTVFIDPALKNSLFQFTLSYRFLSPVEKDSHYVPEKE